MSDHDVCSGEFIVLIVLLLAWSLFENSALSHFLNNIIMHYLGKARQMVHSLSRERQPQGLQQRVLMAKWLCYYISFIFMSAKSQCYFVL